MGGATGAVVDILAIVAISIHAPRGGSDQTPEADVKTYLLFQSTLPVGGATWATFHASLLYAISIHAPRGGSDCRADIQRPPRRDFNPRSPWGERRNFYITTIKMVLFQSTLPVGGATSPASVNSLVILISIHAPRGGSDLSDRLKAGDSLIFQSTLPVGGATLQHIHFPCHKLYISIHAPRGGSD